MATKANQQVEQVIATMPTEYVRTTTFEAYKEEAANKYVLKTDFEALEARVEALEGGTT